MKLGKRNILIAAIMLVVVAAAVYYAVKVNTPDAAQIPSNLVETNKEQQQLLDFNHQMIAGETAEIEAYIKEQPFAIVKSDNGFWYYIIDEGNGKSITKGSRVCLDYSIEFLNGDLCYTSDDNGELCFTAGQRQVPKGLDESVTLLKDGAEAMILLPSHLAYGVSGDGKKVGPYTPLVYIIHVSSVE